MPKPFFWEYAKAILVERQKCFYLFHTWREKNIYIFPGGISPKLIVIA